MTTHELHCQIGSLFAHNVLHRKGCYSGICLVSTTTSVTLPEVGCSYFKSCTTKQWNSALFRPRTLFFKSVLIHQTVLDVEGPAKMLWKLQDWVLTFETKKQTNICIYVYIYIYIRSYMSDCWVNLKDGFLQYIPELFTCIWRHTFTAQFPNLTNVEFLLFIKWQIIINAANILHLNNQWTQ